MRRLLAFVTALFVSLSVMHGEEGKADAVILTHDAVFTMNSMSSGTYKVHAKVLVNNKHGLGAAAFIVYTDTFKSLSSFSGRVEAGGKTLRKVKMSDLTTALVAEGMVSDAFVSVFEPTGPYPFTFEYEYELAYKKGFVSFPVFMPVTSAETAVENASYVLAVPSGTPVQYSSRITPLKESSGSVDNYIWEVKDFAGYVSESMMPDIREFVPYVYSSPVAFEYFGTQGSQESWKESGLWLYSLQKNIGAVPEELRTKVLGLVAGLDDDKEKIKAIYDFLRENTRYVSIQLGIGGFKPFPVETVYKTGFGDCKALSLYMQAMLSIAGIRSDYFIVDTRKADLMKDFHSVGQMNHAMLCVPMDTDSLWIECTNPRYPLGYRHGAVAGHQVVLVKEDGGELVRVKPYPDSLSVRAETINVTLNPDGSASCKGHRRLTLDNVESYIGFRSMDSKAQFRVIMSDNSLNPSDFNITSVEDNFNDWIQLEDSEEYVPEIKIDYSYEVSDYGKVSGDRVFMDLNPFAKSLIASRSARVNDFVIRSGGMLSDKVIVAVPEGYKLESIPSSERIESPFGVFVSNVTYDDASSQIMIDQTIRLNVGRYSKDMYSDYRTFARSVSKAYDAKVVLVKK